MYVPKVITLYVAAHGREEVNQRLEAKRPVRILYSQGCSGICNALFAEDSNRHMKHYYQSFQAHPDLSTYENLKPLSDFFRDERCASMPPLPHVSLRPRDPWIALKTMLSIQLLHQWILDTPQYLCGFGTKRNRRGPIETSPLFVALENSNMGHVLERSAVRSNTISEFVATMNLELYKSHSVHHTIHPPLRVTISEHVVEETARQYATQPDVPRLEDQLFDASCFSSYAFAKPTHEKYYFFSANEDESLDEVTHYQYGIHLLDVRGFPKKKGCIQSVIDFFTRPPPVVSFDPPLFQDHGNTRTVSCTTPLLFNTDSPCVAENGIEWVHFESNALIQQYDIVTQLHIFFSERMAMRGAYELTMSDFIECTVRFELDLLNIIDPTCRNTDTTDLEKNIRVVRNRERLVSFS